MGPLFAARTGVPGASYFAMPGVLLAVVYQLTETGLVTPSRAALA